jgi:hypothetical protein
MGCDGLKVYRHNGLYFAYCIYWAYPSDAGLDVLQEIPRGSSKEEFKDWVTLTREKLEALYEEMKDPELRIQDEQPRNTLFIEWIYEIDLDNLVFHVNSQPMFRLDYMPPSDMFLKAISFDHFGHCALYEHTPVQYRYKWRKPPPTPPPNSLIAYNSCRNRSTTSSVHELLCRPAALSSIERVRTALMELQVTRSMAEDDVGYDVRVLENVPDRNHIPDSLFGLASSLVNFAIGPPMIFLLPRNPHRFTSGWNFLWIRKDVCLGITTHLDDEDNLKASIGDLVHHINTSQDKVGTIYGIAFSIFHCAIVRLDEVGQQGTSFSHTPALQFLPSFYARKISTPGIEALSRLGCLSSAAGGVELLTAISKAYYRRPPMMQKESLVTVPRPVVAKVSAEVWMNVGHFIPSPIDLVSLAAISPEAMLAAAKLARYPWVCYPDNNEVRLVDVHGSGPTIPETTEETDEEDIQQYYRELGIKKFTALEGGRSINVEVGYSRDQDFWSMRRPGPNMVYELRVLKLNDDGVNQVSPFFVLR